MTGREGPGAREESGASSRREVASWTPDPGIGVSACCSVPTDASLIVYGDMGGGVNVLRLLE